MKKSVILAVLGLAAGAATSFGQGFLQFNSYNASSYGGTVVTFLNGGAKVSTGFTADVLYSLTPITEGAGNGALNPSWTFSGAGAPSVNAMNTAFGTGGNAGYFIPTVPFSLNPYTAGTTVYFEVIGYQTSAGSYANSLADRGHSASFSTVLTTGLGLVPYAAYSSWTVAPVPEPTTLALAGLGGLASLIALRRKQA